MVQMHFPQKTEKEVSCVMPPAHGQPGIGLNHDTSTFFQVSCWCHPSYRRHDLQLTL